MKSAFEQIRVLLELKEKGSISEEEFKQMLAILENESAKEAPITEHQNEGKGQNPVEDYQESVQKMEQVLLMLIHNGRTEEARKRFEKFPFKSSIQEKITSILMDADMFREEEPKQVPSGDEDPTNDDQSDEEQIQTNVLSDNWNTKDAPKKKPFFKGWSKKQWLFMVIGLFLISFFTKIPHFIWDSDADGVYNWSDVCPEEKGTEKCMGCPDLDNDGITDNLDLSSSDNDGDQIPNIDDKCPDDWGTIEENGCPTPTSSTTPTNRNADITKSTINTINYPNLKRIFGLRYIRVNSNRYEVSETEFKGFKAVTKKEQIDALNAEFGKSIPGGTKKTGGTTTPVTTNPPAPTKPSGTKAIDFPQAKMNEARIALNDLTYVNNLSSNQKSALNNKIKSICDDYYSGVISGKYKENPKFNKELSEILNSSAKSSSQNNSNSKGMDFPNKSAAYAAFDKFKNATGNDDKTKYRKEFRKYSDAYYAGVTSGKYKESKDFEKFLKKSLKTIDL